MAELTINPQEITEALRKNLDGWEPSLEAATVGYVTAIGDGVARVEGLERAMASELLEFPGRLLGVALNLDEDSIAAEHADEAGLQARRTLGVAECGSAHGCPGCRPLAVAGATGLIRYANTCTEQYAGMGINIYPDAISIIRAGRTNTLNR